MAAGAVSDRGEDNGVYGGQLQPVLFFTATLAAVWLAESTLLEAPSAAASVDSPTATPIEVERACLLWGLFLRGVAALYAVTFLSVLPQVAALAGDNGLYPAQDMLKRARSDVPVPLCWVYFPAGLFWLDASDLTLRAGCLTGAAAAIATIVGAPHSAALLVGCWAALVMLVAVVPMIQYPWDCLLMETGLTAGLLLPALQPVHLSLGVVAPPSAAAVWTLRLVLVRVLLGMGKFKFSQGWRHPDNQHYIKWFLCWQPLPTPLALELYNRMPLWIYPVLHDAMFVFEILVPAAHLSGVYWLRAASAVATMALQVGIHSTGNYGTFNLLTIVLALPLLAPDCPDAQLAATWPEVTAAACLSVLGLLQFPQNSFTTNAWPYVVMPADLAELGDPFRAVAGAVVRVCRLLAPFHVAHGYGVFAPVVPFDCRGQRRVLRISVSFDGGVTYPLELPQKFNSVSPIRQSLNFFAPHQPRLDHQLFYEGFEIVLEETTLTNPYFSHGKSAVSRLAHRIIERQPSVLGLFSAAEASVLAAAKEPPTHVRVAREWVRFATTDERATGVGRVWMPCPPPIGSNSRDVVTMVYSAGKPLGENATPFLATPPLCFLASDDFWGTVAVKA